MQSVNKFRRTGAAILVVSFFLCLVVGYPEASTRALAEQESQANTAPRQDYAAAVQNLERFITHEMADKELPALSIALVGRTQQGKDLFFACSTVTQHALEADP